MSIHGTCCALALISILLPLSSFGAPDSAAPPPDTAILQRSLVRLGNTARLQRVLAKARRGEKVTVGVLGGSITAGASASTEANRYGNRIAQWWRDRFPKAEIAFVNAGIGATGSDIGAHRLRAHLLDKHPDFIVVEYAVNDGNLPIAGETLEGVVRQILNAPGQPALMLMFMMNNSGGNAQEQHTMIGEYYDLPMASYRDALWPEIQAGRMAWTDIAADEVHPNDRGHEYVMRFVTNILEQVRAKLPPDAQLPPVGPVPPPKVSDVFEHTAMYSAKTATPVANEGWETFEDPGWVGFFGPGWKSAKPGSTIEFDLEGRAISVMFYRIKGDMGIAEAQVDDGAHVRMDAWFEATWGGYTPFQLVARDLKPGKHRLRIRLLEDKNPGSSGHEFRIHALMVAGLDGSEKTAKP